MFSLLDGKIFLLLRSGEYTRNFAKDVDKLGMQTSM